MAKRAQKTALKRGRQAEAADIEDLLSFSLDLEADSPAAAGAENRNIQVDF